jgi:alpha-glucoside transport system substrate-binding protein
MKTVIVVTRWKPSGELPASMEGGMPIYDRRQRSAIDQLVEDYSQSGLSRREFIKRAVAAGLSISAASTLLAACGGGGSSSVIQTNKIDLITTWGDGELDSFNAVIDPFKSQNGITITIESTRDVNATLTTRLAGNNPPDVAILPNPGKMQQLAAEHHLVALDSFLDMSKVRNDYANAWINLGSYNGHLYSIFYRVANKGTIWYSPKQFQTNGYQIPSTWDQMVTLSNQIAGSGKFPWAMGVESGSASGWPGADWIAQILLNQAGPDVYDKWVAHTIPWTDSNIKNAFQMFGQIAGGSHYINGAPQSILATNFQPASYLPFNTPPQAYMYYLGDFTQGFIQGQFKSFVPGTDFNFFPFPTINSQYAGAVTGGADLVTALRNTTAVQKLVAYLATAEAQEIWVKRGGFITPNKGVPLDTYPDAVVKASVQQLQNASLYRFGADDLMPSAVEDAFWKAVLSYIQTPSSLDSILSGMESTAAQAYH